MNNDIRNLSKWLNEEQEAPIDRQALARVLAMAQLFATRTSQLLDRKAENARELGLDYEPARPYRGTAYDMMREALADHSERPLDMVAEQALDKMAENARELGLDYEPEQPAQPAVPDAIGPNEDELPEHAPGWNDCRELMLSWRTK